MKVSRPIKHIVWAALTFFAHVVPRAPRMTVLLYHSISNEKDFFAVTPEEFTRQMNHISDHVDVVPLSRAFAHAKGDRVIRDSVAVTFDDGYQDFVTNALPVLKAKNIPATLFVLGPSPDREELGNEHSFITSEGLNTLASEPLVTIGSHSLTHKKLSKLSNEELKRELHESHQGREYLAYPKGSFNDSVVLATVEEGYEGAVSVIERGVIPGDNLFALPRVQIDSSTAFSQFKAKLTQAVDWYYVLWSLMKPKK